MWDNVKIPLQVCIVNARQPFLSALINRLQCLVCRSVRTKSIGTVLEIRLKNRFQYQQRSHLDHPIFQSGYAQWPELSGVAFGYVAPSNRAGSIAFLFQFFLDLVQKCFNPSGTCLDLLSVDPVHPAGFAVSTYLFPCRMQHVLTVDPVIQRIEPKLRFPLGLLIELPLQKIEIGRQQVRLDRVAIQELSVFHSVVGVSPKRFILHINVSMFAIREGLPLRLNLYRPRRFARFMNSSRRRVAKC
jgi:hypothetical protein